MIPEPRLATTICVLAEGDRLEVLMVRRSPAMRFMPGAWVFPGGVVDAADDASADIVTPDTTGDHGAWAAAGVREVLEETGVWLSDPPVVVPVSERAGVEPAGLAAVHGPVDGSRVLHLSTWITPTAVPVRFHTRFSVTAIEHAVDGEPDGVEVDRIAWVEPATLVAAGDAGEVALPLPTRHTLAELAALGTVDTVFDTVRHRRPPVFQPRLVVDGDVLVALLPGDDGYDDAPDLPPDPATIGRVVAVRDIRGRPVPEIRPR